MKITKENILELIHKVEEQGSPKEFYFRFGGITGKGKSMEDAFENWKEIVMKGGTE